MKNSVDRFEMQVAEKYVSPFTWVLVHFDSNLLEVLPRINAQEYLQCFITFIHQDKIKAGDVFKVVSGYPSAPDQVRFDYVESSLISWDVNSGKLTVHEYSFDDQKFRFTFECEVEQYGVVKHLSGHADLDEIYEFGTAPADVKKAVQELAELRKKHSK